MEHIMDMFELKLELLKMAQSIEMEKIFSARIKLENDYEAASKAYASYQAPKYPQMPTPYAPDIVETAKVLYEFVMSEVKKPY